ncbi:MAG: tetratricopeptide repeat protein, partial [Pyrinomonadaceae bacterium]
ISPTATAVRLMTPDYASPEQVRGDSITTASDVYSLGVLLYELLSGHRPYRVKASTPQEIVRVVCEIEPERPSTIISHTEELRGPEGELQKTLTPETVSRTREGEPEKLRRQLAGDLDNIVLMAMRKEPQRRYTSVQQFSEDLRRHLEGLPVIARKDTFAYRTEKFVKRNRVGVAVAAIIVALILGSIILTSVQSARLARERDKAARERDRAERVSAFLGDLFKVSDPSQAKGNTITAREILDKGAEKITKELNDQPEVQATLMDTIGRVYYSLGLFDRAAPLLQMALERQQRILGDNHPDVLSTRAAWLASTAAIKINESNFAAAERPAQEALAIRRTLLGNEHTDVLDSLNTLATVIYSKGDLTTAEQLFREALTLRRKLFGEDHPDIASYINNLGFLLYEKGDYQSAEPLFRDALARHRRLRGKDDPTTATSINNLALVLQNQSRYDEAEPLFREALEIRRKAFGEEHAGVAQSTNNLAGVLTDKADYAAAEPLFRRALELRRKLLPKGNSQIGVTLVGLGRLLVLRDDARGGELMLREGLEILQKSYAKDYWRVAEATSLMGESLTALKRFDEAEPLLLEGYSTFKTIRGERHRQTQQALTRLVNLYQTWGKPDKVAEYRALIPK